MDGPQRCGGPISELGVLGILSSSECHRLACSLLTRLAGKARRESRDAAANAGGDFSTYEHEPRPGRSNVEAIPGAPIDYLLHAAADLIGCGRSFRPRFLLDPFRLEVQRRGRSPRRHLGHPFQSQPDLLPFSSGSRVWKTAQFGRRVARSYRLATPDILLVFLRGNPPAFAYRRVDHCGTPSL
jgi:hypothetical protein